MKVIVKLNDPDKTIWTFSKATMTRSKRSGYVVKSKHERHEFPWSSIKSTQEIRGV